MKILHLICNAHIDPVWLWRWQDGAVEALSTFRIAADFCEKYEGFVFNHNEAVLYKWIEEYDNELFLKIQRLVVEKKWHIMGGWHLQSDCNMPCGESFVRQILTGKTYFQEKFDVSPTTAVCFDAFGHTRGLVQILKKSGYDSYMHMRPGGENGDSCWVGFDGSEIIKHRIYGGYNTLKGEAKSKIEHFIKLNEQCGKEHYLLTWGIGNHGGGPSRIDIEEISKLQKVNKDFRITHSTPEKYFENLNINELPKVYESCRPSMVGCYSSMAKIKKLHRTLENKLYVCEKMVSHTALH